jgi:hypothetical protein
VENARVFGLARRFSGLFPGIVFAFAKWQEYLMSAGSPPFMPLVGGLLVRAFVVGIAGPAVLVGIALLAR